MQAGPFLLVELNSYGYETQWEFLAHHKLLRDSLWDTDS